MFHPCSRTLLLADLAFNLGPPASWLTQLGLRLSGVWDRFAPTRTCRLLSRDRAATRACPQRILAWDFDCVDVGHGRNVPHGGRDALRSAFAFLNP